MTKPNDYQKAIVSIGQILLDYCPTQMVPVYGFGAVCPPPFSPRQETCHCFPVTLDVDQHFVGGIQGIIEAYNHSLQRIQFSGPTNFSEIIEQSMECSKLLTHQDPSKHQTS